MKLFGMIALIEAVIIVIVLIISGIALINIVINHFIRTRYCRPSAMIYIYVFDAIAFVILGLGYGGYLIALWSSDGSHYNAKILFWTGFSAGSILSIRQIGVFYLGIERIITILWPIDSQIVRFQMSFILCALCLSSQLAVIVIGSGIIGSDVPSNTDITVCQATSCLMSTSRLSVYLYFRVIWSTVNFLIGIVLCFILRRTENIQKMKSETRLSTKVAVTTFFSSFVFDFLPHVTVQILYQTLRNGLLSNIGPYSIFFGSLDVVLSSLFCYHSFRQQRKKVDDRKAAYAASSSLKPQQQQPHQQHQLQEMHKSVDSVEQ